MKNLLIVVLIFLTVTAAQAKKVRFSVDMTGQTINTTGVHVSGDFQEEAGFSGGDWQPNTTAMTKEEGSQIFSVVVDIPAFTKYEYKFLNGDQWYDVEFVPVESRVGYDYNDNRWVYVDSLYNDTMQISPVLYSGNAPGGQYLLRLKVDLQYEAEIDPAGVHVAGNFQGWDPSLTPLYNFAEKVYEGIVYIDAETGYGEYRFINGNTSDDFETVPSACTINENRHITVPYDTVMETVCYSSCTACGIQGVNEVPEISKARIYPNPCRDYAILEFNDSELNHKVTITDQLGKTWYVYDDCSAGSLVIRCDSFKEGIYFIKIENGQQGFTTLRMVKSE